MTNSRSHTFCSGLVASQITNYNMKTKRVPMPSTGKLTDLFSVKVRRNHAMQDFLDSARAALMFCFVFRMSESISDI